MNKLTLTAAFLLTIPMIASAQSESHKYRGQGYGFFGLGLGLDFPSSAGEQLGFGGDGFLYKGFGFGGEAAWSHYSRFRYDHDAWIGSLDASYHFGRRAARGGVDPFLLGGFSLYGPTAKGGGRGQPGENFGGGVNLWLADHAALRLEVREHVNTANYLPGNVAIAFRIGVTFR